jgi:hypothetical protein
MLESLVYSSRLPEAFRTSGGKAASKARRRVVPYFEILMRSKTIHEATRNVISCPFRVSSWIVLAQGKTTRNQFRALPDAAST